MVLVVVEAVLMSEAGVMTLVLLLVMVLVVVFSLKLDPGSCCS